MYRLQLYRLQLYTVPQLYITIMRIFIRLMKSYRYIIEPLIYKKSKQAYAFVEIICIMQQHIKHICDEYRAILIETPLNQWP